MEYNFENPNFIIMVICVYCIICISVYFPEWFIKNNTKMIRFPEILSVFWCNENDVNNDEQNRIPYTTFFVYIFTYFVFVFFIISALHQYPVIMIFIKHVAVILVIFLFVWKMFKPVRGIPLGIAFTLLWLYSSITPYKWIINDIIVLMCICLCGYVRFRNFVYLQIFMWITFAYDFYLLKSIGNRHEFPKSFEVTEGKSTTFIDEKCLNLLCNFFKENMDFEVPTSFSINLGEYKNYVAIGSGDIMIGSFIANFTFRFFKKTSYMLLSSFAFVVAVSILPIIIVVNIPFPALVTIVPICSVTLVLMALFSNRLSELFNNDGFNSDETEPNEVKVSGV